MHSGEKVLLGPKRHGARCQACENLVKHVAEEVALSLVSALPEPHLHRELLLGRHDLQVGLREDVPVTATKDGSEGWGGKGAEKIKSSSGAGSRDERKKSRARFRTEKYL